MDVRRLIMVAVLTLTVGCSYEPIPGTVDGRTLPGTSRDDVIPGSQSNSEGLISAQHPHCDVGADIVAYLRTGDNQGDPSLDLLFADSVGVTDPQARAIAGRYVQQCDEQAYAAEAAVAEADATRELEAAGRSEEEEATGLLSAQESKACGAVGGRYADRLCHSTVEGNPTGAAGGECVYPDGIPHWVGFVDGEIDQAFFRAEKDLGCFR